MNSRIAQSYPVHIQPQFGAIKPSVKLSTPPAPVSQKPRVGSMGVFTLLGLGVAALAGSAYVCLRPSVASTELKPTSHESESDDTSGDVAAALLAIAAAIAAKGRQKKSW